MGMIDMDLVAYADTMEAEEAFYNAAVLQLYAIAIVGMLYAVAWAMERAFG